MQKYYLIPRQVFFHGLGILVGITLLILSLVQDFLAVSPHNILAIIVLILMLIMFRIHNYLNPIVAIGLPWLIVLSFIFIPISIYSRPLSDELYAVISIFLSIIIISYFLFTNKTSNKETTFSFYKNYIIHNINDMNYNIFVIFFVILSCANIYMSGYIPLIEGFMTGNTRYKDFGVKSLNGFYNAFGNALAILSLYLFIYSRKNKYIIIYLLVLLLFVLFVTRQNIISVFIESLIIYSFIVKKISINRLLISMFISLLIFFLIGNFRTGNISEVSGIIYSWVPDSFSWIYSYGYFNLLNLDNLITNPDTPIFDGSVFYRLIPSIIRPESELSSYTFLELKNFTVSSFLFEVYKDMGSYGVLVFSLIILYATFKSYQNANLNRNFTSVAFYAVLYFCAMFSFFTNMWFYLPIIFQLVFIKIFSIFIIKERYHFEYSSRYS